MKGVKVNVSRDVWESFFENPVLRSIIEEAQLEQVESDDDPIPEKENSISTDNGQEDGSLNLEQLAADFQQGNLSQDDLINLYKSGQLSQEDIQQIMQAGQGEEQPQVDENGNPIDPNEPQSQEELLAQQIDQTNDMFVKFALYDKINELTDKLDYFKENFEDLQSGIYDRVIQLREFLNILSSLIFSIETSISYQMYGSILLQLTELFDQYNREQQVEATEHSTNEK
jgi:hypothetical protein